MSAIVKLCASLILAASLALAGAALAGHDRDKKGPKTFAPVDNALYKAQCGACHFAYQPELLPARSWEAILAKPGDHFGESLDIGPADLAALRLFTASRAADQSRAKRAVKITRSLGSATPRRVTEVPYLVEKHHDLAAEVFKRPGVGSFANCPACHRAAEAGDYDDDRVSIPR